MNAREFGAQSFHQLAPGPEPEGKPGKPLTIIVECFEHGVWVEHKLYLQPDGTYKETK